MVNSVGIVPRYTLKGKGLLIELRVIFYTPCDFSVIMLISLAFSKSQKISRHCYQQLFILEYITWFYLSDHLLSVVLATLVNSNLFAFCQLGFFLSCYVLFGLFVSTYLSIVPVN